MQAEEGSGDTARKLRGSACSSEHLTVAYVISTTPIVYKTIRRNDHIRIYTQNERGGIFAQNIY